MRAFKEFLWVCFIVFFAVGISRVTEYAEQFRYDRLSRLPQTHGSSQSQQQSQSSSRQSSHVTQRGQLLPHEQPRPTPQQKAPKRVERLVGKVVRVSDGDTITILDEDQTQYRIRLAQIDAPENGAPFSKRSKQALTQMIAGQVIEVMVSTKDRYERLVGTLWLNGQDINLAMVAQGMAWAYPQYLWDEHYIEVEYQAREQRIGLWSDPQVIAPWEWRRHQRAKRRQVQ